MNPLSRYASSVGTSGRVTRTLPPKPYSPAQKRSS